MALKKSELYSSLWASCDELRGGMDASQYKDYVLSLLFIKYISDNHPGVIFVLLGNWAKRKSALIDTSKHPIITAAHPSPLSAHRGFFGSKIFSRCNTAAEKLGYKAPF